MLNIDNFENGIVLDHIKAGAGMAIYNDLRLDKLDCCVAIIQNARSNKLGRKDIIKIENSMDKVDLDAIGYIDPNITINVVQNGKIVEKRAINPPKKITNIIRCHNPRCITTIEQELPHIFVLSDEKERVYRCIYCEETYKR